MAYHFSANQYEDAFISHRLQNHEVPKQFKGATWFNNYYQSGRPKAQEGCTQIIANDRGHIVECGTKSDKNPWGDFVGTWDLPKKIPGNCATVKTARRADAQDQLARHMDCSNVVISGQDKNMVRKNKGCPLPVEVPAGAPAATLLEATKISPAASTTARRSGAEAPVPESASPKICAAETEAALAASPPPEAGTPAAAAEEC